MKEKIAGGIVRHRYVILILGLILAAFCVPGIGKTRINYDLTRYLSESTMTRRALTVMQAEFGSTEQLRVMFHDLEDETLSQYVREMNELPQVQLAVHEKEKDAVERDGHVWQLVTLTLKDCDGAALVEELRGMFPSAGDYAVGGSAASQLDVQESVGREIPVVMAIAVAVVLLVLLLTSRAWLEPPVILAVLALSILINMGTNFIFPDVSFITFAVCAILQLALSIDYAIMLLHAWNDRRQEGLEAEQAMIRALADSFMPISSSAFTTVAGLLSLLFMSFTIGFDIGLVLSKGIVISMLSVFLLMPAMTLLCKKGLIRTQHRPIRLGGAHLARGVLRGRRVIAAILSVAAIAGFVLQSGNTYTFTDTSSANQGETGQIKRIFGSSDPLALLVPGGDTEADYDRQRALAQALSEIEIGGERAFDGVAAMVTTGAAALETYTAQDVADLTGLPPFSVNLFFLARGFGSSVRADRLLDAAGGLLPGDERIDSLKAALDTARTAFIGPHYTRMLLTPRFPVGDGRMGSAIDQTLAKARAEYGEDVYLTGVAMSTYDIGQAFQGDLLRVNLITLAAIFLIVALSFRHAGVAAVLVFVIEGAIWLCMAVSRLLGQPIFFMSYLICVSIQMGATIDYAILLTQQYRSARKSGRNAADALTRALAHALPTVLTSGIIMITAGYIIGRLCSVYYISSIGLLLSRGAAISVILVLVFLPALLTLFERDRKRTMPVKYK